MVISSQEEEHNAHMVTKLDQYRTDLPTEIISALDIPRYFFEQFRQRVKDPHSAAYATKLRYGLGLLHCNTNCRKNETKQIKSNNKQIQVVNLNSFLNCEFEQITFICVTDFSF